MLKNLWYSIQHASKVTDTPVRVKALGQDLVIWRDDTGAPVVQSDLCVHRGGALSGGWVQKGVNGHNCVVCPYHGWQFDDEGACVRIPAARPDLPIPRKARTDTYPAVERYGFIWAFLGDLPEAERPPLPELPGLDPVAGAVSEGYRMVEGEFLWNANYERVIENGADIAHAPFVHAGSFGNPDKPEVPEHEITEDWTDDGRFLRSIFAEVDLDPPPPQGMWKYLRKSAERPPVHTKVGILFPNTSMLEVNLPLGQIRIWTAHVPIDDDHTASRWIAARNFFTQPWAVSLLRADQDTYRRTMKIFYEDQETVEGQRPELVPFELGAELNVKSDAISLAYRRWRTDAFDRGWGVQPHQIHTTDDKRVHTVIPSPARRDNPDLANAWVLREIESHAVIHARNGAAAADLTDDTTQEASRG